MSQAPPSPAPPRRRLSPRLLAAVLAVWVAAVGGALLIADALDSPVGEGARDEARAVAPGPVVAPGAGGLQPLTLFLDRPLPDEIAQLPPIARPAALVGVSRGDPDPRWLVALGSALQLVGRTDQAGAAYRAALRRDPGDVAARAGLVVLEGSRGGAGLETAAAGLGALAQENPRDQLIAFNQGIVDLYRRRPAGVVEAWNRTIELDPDSYLGRRAAEGLAELARAAGSAP